MNNFENALLNETASLKDAIASLNLSNLKIVALVDKSKHLIGVITDSDIRREMLKNTSLDAKVKDFAILNPIVGYTGQSKQDYISILKTSNIFQLPILDANNKVVEIKTLHDLVNLETPQLLNDVILMAGGMGTRLYPITENIPKPLVPINGKPIISMILDNLYAKGFKNVSVSIKHLGEMIKEELASNSDHNQLKYIEETKRLGTAGALGLIKVKPKHPIIVQNADTLTTLDYESMLEFHQVNKNFITMAVRREKITIPYGVVQTDDNQVVSIEEKPDHHYFSNIGIYIISPDALKLIPKETYFDMTTLIQKCLNLDLRVGSFLAHEYWTDIGLPEQLAQAQIDSKQHFKYA